MAGGADSDRLNEALQRWSEIRDTKVIAKLALKLPSESEECRGLPWLGTLTLEVIVPFFEAF